MTAAYQMPTKTNNPTLVTSILTAARSSPHHQWEVKGSNEAVEMWGDIDLEKWGDYMKERSAGGKGSRRRGGKSDITTIRKVREPRTALSRVLLSPRKPLTMRTLLTPPRLFYPLTRIVDLTTAGNGRVGILGTLTEVGKDVWAMRGRAKEGRKGEGEEDDPRMYFVPGDDVSMKEGQVVVHDFAPLSNVRVDRSANTGEAHEVVVTSCVGKNVVDSDEGVVREGDVVKGDVEGIVVRYGGGGQISERLVSDNISRIAHTHTHTHDLHTKRRLSSKCLCHH